MKKILQVLISLVAIGYLVGCANFFSSTPMAADSTSLARLSERKLTAIGSMDEIEFFKAELPFVNTGTEKLRIGEGKKVFAHYMPQFPLSIDNKEIDVDYYTTQYLDPKGEQGKHLAYGGYLRQRPLSPCVGTDNWRVRNYTLEIARALAGGVDGFLVDILSTSGRNWQNVLDLISAAENYPSDFKIVLIADMQSTLMSEPANIKLLAATMQGKRSALRTEDGSTLLSVYNAQNETPQWWDSQLEELGRFGLKTRLLLIFQGWNRYIPTYANVSYGVSDWGVRSRGANQSWYKNIPEVPADIKIMMPVSPQDYRPKGRVFWEAKNSENYRTMWENAIASDAAMVQIITWNDYSESTEISPSSLTNHAWLTLTAYYASWFKSGNRPAIKDDSVLYFHRLRSGVSTLSVADDLRNNEIRLMPGSDPAQNEVEILFFAKDRADVEVRIGRKTTLFSAATPGLHSFRVPSSPGRLKVIIQRHGLQPRFFCGVSAITEGSISDNLLYSAGGGLVTGPCE